MFTIGQGTAGATAVRLCQLPPGPCSVTISSASTSSADAYIGLYGEGGTVTTSTGCPVSAGRSIPLTRYPGQGADTLGVISSGTASLGWIISAP